MNQVAIAIRVYINDNVSGDPDGVPCQYKVEGAGLYIARPTMVGVKTPDGAVWVSYYTWSGSDWVKGNVPLHDIGAEYTIRGETRTVPDWKTTANIPDEE